MQMKYSLLQHNKQADEDKRKKTTHTAKTRKKKQHTNEKEKEEFKNQDSPPRGTPGQRRRSKVN